MINIGVVILNYIAYEATIDCVKSIRQQKTIEAIIDILIVDNGSMNDSVSKLNEEFYNCSDVTVLALDENVGFANGNNYGYYHLKNNKEYDYFIFSNDDIQLINNNLVDWLEECYRKHKFAVLGPSIYAKRGRFFQNPCPNLSMDPKDIKTEINRRKKEVLKIILKKLFRKRIYYGENVWLNELYCDFNENLTLHGSFLVFSRLYFKYYEEPFDPRTFLYIEENILKLRCDRAKLKMIYSPQYSVVHEQGLSSTLLYADVADKRIKRLKNEIRSLKVYLEEIVEGKNRWKNIFL